MLPLFVPVSFCTILLATRTHSASATIATCCFDRNYAPSISLADRSESETQYDFISSCPQWGEISEQRSAKDCRPILFPRHEGARLVRRERHDRMERVPPSIPPLRSPFVLVCAPSLTGPHRALTHALPRPPPASALRAAACVYRLLGLRPLRSVQEAEVPRFRPLAVLS